MKLIASIIFTFFSLTLFRVTSFAQEKKTKSSRLFLSVGAGTAGSFFVRDYDETLPFPSSGFTAFYKKKFIGSASEIAIGVRLKKNIAIKLGYNRQRFTKRVYVTDTLSRGVGLLIDHRIQHIDNIWFAGMTKSYTRKKNQVFWGAGLYNWTGQLQTIEVYENYIIDKEFIFKGFKSGDLGAYIELGYEYQFQPKVNIGIKSQFFWIVSGSYPSSIALYPFIKLNF